MASGSGTSLCLSHCSVQNSILLTTIFCYRNQSIPQKLKAAVVSVTCNRLRIFHLNIQSSSSIKFISGVTQGSMPGPIWFTLCMLPLGSIIRKHIHTLLLCNFIFLSQVHQRKNQVHLNFSTTSLNNATLDVHFFKKLLSLLTILICK